MFESLYYLYYLYNGYVTGYTIIKEYEVYEYGKKTYIILKKGNEIYKNIIKYTPKCIKDKFNINILNYTPKCIKDKFNINILN